MTKNLFLLFLLSFVALCKAQDVYVVRNYFETVEGGTVGLGIDANPITSHNSGSYFYAEEGQTIKFQAYDNQSYSGYNYVFNDDEAQNCKSVWKIINYSKITLFGEGVSNPTRIATVLENGYSFASVLRKECNVNIGLQNAQGDMNGSLWIDDEANSTLVPSIKHKIAGNKIKLRANTTIAGATGTYMDYVFSNWSVNGTQYSGNATIEVTIGEHSTIKAYYKAKPNNGYKNFAFTGNTNPGQCMTFSWSEHPNPGVNCYNIYRTVKNHPESQNELIGTVNRGTTTFTDLGSIYATGYSDLIYFDVRAHYQPDNTDAPESFASIVGRFTNWNIAENKEKLQNGNAIGKENIIIQAPKEYKLGSYPNPFNPATVIRYAMPATGQVTLKVYNILSQEVATLVNEVKEAGEYSANFNASNLPSGIYIARLKAGSKVMTIKMQLVK